MLPPIQIFNNTARVSVFWDRTPDVVSYKLYWSSINSMGTYNLIRKDIANYANFGKERVRVEFLRDDVGLTDADSFYLTVSTVDSAGLESSKGDPRMIANLVGRQSDAGAANSPITSSENVSTHIASGNATRVHFTQDVCFVEIFNNSANNVLYVDVTGVDATAAKSMPVYPYVYYTAYRNLNKTTGLSLIAGGPDVIDARIVIHY